MLAVHDHCRSARDVIETARRASAWRHQIWGRPQASPAPVTPVAPIPTKRRVHQPITLPYGRVRTCDVIQAAVICFGISREDLIGHCRQARFVVPRQAAMCAARRLTTDSFPMLGRRFGGRDHTTILHAVQKAEHHPELQRAIAELIEVLATAAAASAGEGEGATDGE